jgi:DnaK suppressor protein
MTKADLQHYQQALLSLRRRLTGDVSQLAGEALTTGRDNGGPAAPMHPAEQGTDAFEQEFTLSLLKNQEQALEEIADALDRIEKGAFGRCEECGGAIPKARLQALPYARHCVACARKVQQSS